MNLSPILATTIGVAGACAGSLLPLSHKRTRFFVPISGAILLGVSLLAILPEMAGAEGWTRAIIGYLFGYSVLFVVNRYIHPVCPTCAHDHDHEHCDLELHGFSAPLVIATAIHAFLDGWGMTVAQGAASSMRSAVPIAVILHKVPEGLALGVMLRASLKSRTVAAGWGTAAESATAIGAVVAIALLPEVSPAWGHDLLSVAGGTFLYLGFHAIHGALAQSVSARHREPHPVPPES